MRASMEDFIRKYPNVISRACSHLCEIYTKYDKLKEKLAKSDDAAEKISLLCDEVGCKDVAPIITFLTLLQETQADGDGMCFTKPLKRLKAHQRATSFLPLSEECTSHSPSRVLPGCSTRLSGFEEAEVLNIAFAIDISLTAFYADEFESPIPSPQDPEPPDSTSWEA